MIPTSLKSIDTVNGITTIVTQDNTAVALTPAAAHEIAEHLSHVYAIYAAIAKGKPLVYAS